MKSLNSNKPEIIDLKQRFRKLSVAPFEEQIKFFCTRYIYLLGEDGYAEVKDVAAEFQRYCGNNRELSVMDPRTSKFLEDAGHEFVSQFEKNDIFATLDIDNNKKISLIEYLLYRYKPQILMDYFRRIDQPHRIPENEDLLYKCVDPDVGYALISELLDMPAYGVDAVLDKMTKSVEDDKIKEEQEIAQLEAQLQSGSNVQRKQAEAQLKIKREGNFEERQNKMRLSIKKRANVIHKDQTRKILEIEHKKAANSDSGKQRFQTVTAPNKPKLPAGWKEYFDDDSQLPYYYNENTGKTQWDRPT